MTTYAAAYLDGRAHEAACSRPLEVFLALMAVVGPLLILVAAAVRR